MSRRVWYWIVALAFAVHNAEEGIAAPLMLRLMESRGPTFLRGFYAGIEVAELRTSLVILSLVGLGVAAAAARAITSRAWSYAMLVFGAVMGLNALVHIGLSIAFQGYMPGSLTAIFVTLPVSVALLIRSHREKWIAPAAYWSVLPVAALVHGPLLAAFLAAVIRGVRVFTRGAA